MTDHLRTSVQAPIYRLILGETIYVPDETTGLDWRGTKAEAFVRTEQWVNGGLRLERA
jgi:hypothetical protein